MADLARVAWLLARVGYSEAGKVIVLSREFAHDSRLLAGWQDPYDFLCLPQANTPKVCLLASTAR